MSEEIQLKGEWKQVKVCPDSGAYIFVSPPSMAPDVPIIPTPASKKGSHMKSASNHLIPNMGQQIIEGKHDDFNLKSKWQVAPVSKPLAGVVEMVRKKNRVVFDEDDLKYCKVKSILRIPDCKDKAYHHKNPK